MTQSEPLTISQLQRRIKADVERSFPSELLVRGEIVSMNRNSQSGHVFIDLAETRGGSLLASMRANIWNTQAPYILNKFQQGTGYPLASGMEVVLRVAVTYSLTYSLSLNVRDIFPEFNVGAKEIERKKTIEALKKENLLDRQKSLVLSPIPYRLAVVSSPGAAGWGDFLSHLTGNEWGFKYDVRLFEAIVQGDGAPASIIEALRKIYTSPVPFDAVLLLRGGGSQVDLSCFDDYKLCRALAMTRVPLITAIGHDRDNHVADMVANMSVKTPTALADLFIDITRRQDDAISSLENRMTIAVGAHLERYEKIISSFEQAVRHKTAARLDLEDRALSSMETLLRQKVIGRLDLEEAHFSSLVQSIRQGTLSRLERELSSLLATVEGISKRSSSRLSEGERELSTLWDRVVKGTLAHVDRGSQKIEIVSSQILRTAKATVKMRISLIESHIQYIETRIKGSDPRNPLLKGNSVVTDREGVKLSSVGGRKSGDAIRVMFADGNLDCLVQKVTRVENVPGASGKDAPGDAKDGATPPPEAAVAG